MQATAFQIEDKLQHESINLFFFEGVGIPSVLLLVALVNSCVQKEWMNRVI